MVSPWLAKLAGILPNLSYWVVSMPDPGKTLVIFMAVSEYQPILSHGIRLADCSGSMPIPGKPNPSFRQIDFREVYIGTIINVYLSASSLM